MQWVSHDSKRPMQRVSGYVVSLKILDIALLEPRPFELPIKVIAAVFKHMAESGIAFWILKVIENRFPKGQENNIPEAIEIWSCTDENSPGSQHLPQALQRDITWYRQMFNYFGEKDHVEFDVEL